MQFYYSWYDIFRSWVSLRNFSVAFRDLLSQSVSYGSKFAFMKDLSLVFLFEHKIVKFWTLDIILNNCFWNENSLLSLYLLSSTKFPSMHALYNFCPILFHWMSSMFIRKSSPNALFDSNWVGGDKACDHRSLFYGKLGKVSVKMQTRKVYEIDVGAFVYIFDFQLKIKWKFIAERRKIRFKVQRFSIFM